MLRKVVMATKCFITAVGLNNWNILNVWNHQKTYAPK